MGCDYYDIEGATVSFSDYWDGGCLCTFPHNHMDATGNGKMYPETVAKLAMLGAAVVLKHNDPLGFYDKYVFIPDGLPEWVVSEIYRILNVNLDELK